MLFIKKKAKDAEIIAAKAAEEAKAAEGIQEAPKVELVKCPKCGREVEKERVKNAKYICYECGSYFRVKTKNRIRMVTDPKSFEPWFEDMPSSNPLGTEGYEDKVAAAQAKTNLKEAVTIGKATINGEPAVVGVCDARFLMSSMGYVVGEKIARAVEKATEEKLPVFMFCCSGGARMQEGIISLMQMAKTTGVIAKLAEHKLPFISVLTDPTMGGVSASFAFMGDVVMAEPKALIGFAGPRVIEQTVREQLPEGFQRSEFLLQKGAIDMIVDRKNLKMEIAKLIALFQKESLDAIE